MNKNKMRTFLEIIYNCPFLLLVIITSLVYVLFFDETGILKIDKDMAVFHMYDEGVLTAKREDNAGENGNNTLKNEQNFDAGTVEEKEETVKREEKTEQNAGLRKEEKDTITSKTSQKIDIAKLEREKNREKEESRATKFVEYEPIETNSRYYSDAGKVALTTEYDYVLENESYFNDAVFLGDSRTLGIADYAGLDGADFFCDNGMTIYKLLEDTGVTYQKTGKKVDLKKALQEKHYGKIYIMLGMNELGYGDTRMYLRQYLKVLNQLREWQPEAVIYIMANLHVSRGKNNMETEFNNININDKNVASARLANGRDIFYLDSNPLFTDEEGYLPDDSTFDGVHLYAQHYEKWRNFLFEHGVEKSAEGQGAQEQEGSGEAETQEQEESGEAETQEQEESGEARTQNGQEDAEDGGDAAE